MGEKNPGSIWCMNSDEEMLIKMPTKISILHATTIRSHEGLNRRDSAMDRKTCLRSARTHGLPGRGVRVTDAQRACGERHQVTAIWQAAQHTRIRSLRGTMFIMWSSGVDSWVIDIVCAFPRWKWFKNCLKKRRKGAFPGDGPRIAF